MQTRFADTPTKLALGALLLTLAGASQAQVYRNVGPDGRVTFSDTPPAQAPVREVQAARGTESSGTALPYQLGQTVQRFPVTLYTAANCVPCVSGRNLLLRRGVPFTEKTVDTNADIAALQKLAGVNSLPLLTIGAQQIKGFAEIEWMQYLDAAGYPKSSQLPGSWRQPAATSLVPPEAAPATAAAAAPATTAGTQAPATTSDASPVTPSPTATNPAGIRF